MPPRPHPCAVSSPSRCMRAALTPRRCLAHLRARTHRIQGTSGLRLPGLQRRRAHRVPGRRGAEPRGDGVQTTFNFPFPPLSPPPRFREEPCQNPVPSCHAAWAALRCPMICADWCTVGGVVSKMGLQAAAARRPRGRLLWSVRLLDALPHVQERVRRGVPGRPRGCPVGKGCRPRRGQPWPGRCIGSTHPRSVDHRGS